MFDTLYKENKCSKMKLTRVVLDKGPLICVSADTVNCFKKCLDKFWSNLTKRYCITTRQISMATETAVY